MWVLYWYLIGLVIASLMTYRDYYRGTDITVGNIFFTVVIAVLGPIVAIVAAIVLLTEHGKQVVFRRKQPKE